MTDEKRGTRIIRCPTCRRYYRLTGAATPPSGTRMRCTKCGEVFTLAGESTTPAPAAPPAAARGRILLATDGVEFQAIISEVLLAAGYELRTVENGDDAWRDIMEWLPQVVLLDVALSGTPAFELCDRVRAHPRQRGLGIILIASVFQQTRYKRAPTSLYGADDYIEKHHIKDRLPEKVGKLMAPGTPPPAPAAHPHARAQAHPPKVRPGDRIDPQEQETLIREEIGDQEATGPRQAAGPQEPEGSHEHARRSALRLRENLKRYARIIVSDIALYNQELVERGIREGSFYQVLKTELEEGRRLYLTRVPPTAGEADYFQEAVREFIEKRRGGHEGGAPRGRTSHGRS